MNLYIEYLSGIPPYLLCKAAEYHIQHSPWFPRISELRQAAARLARTSHFDHLPSFPLNRLAAQAQAMEDAFYDDRVLDFTAWQSLARQFEAADRTHRSTHILALLGSASYRCTFPNLSDCVAFG